MSMYILEDQDYTQITLGIFVHQEKFLFLQGLTLSLSNTHHLVSTFRQQNYEAVNERYKENTIPKPLTKGIMPTPSPLELEKLLYQVVSNSQISTKPPLAQPFLDAVRLIIVEERKAQLAAEYKETKRIEEELAKTPWQIGDILYTSWGYEQTNVSFYQVTRMVTAGISSDDPDAISKIEVKLQRMISSQDFMKTINKAYKKEASVASLMATGLLNQHQAEKIIFAVEKETANFLKRPFPAFLISNNNANINRLKKRLEELKTKTARENIEIEVSQEITYREDTVENRIMFLFPGKPDEETRSILKRHAFRWSPSRGAWVRHLNNAGRFAAKRVIEKLNEESN